MEIWKDAEFLGRVWLVRRFMAYVFGLDQTADHHDWSEVVTRIGSGRLTDAERKRLADNTLDVEWVADVVEKHKLPGVFDELDERLDQDFAGQLNRKAKAARSGLKSNPDEIRWIVDQVHQGLVWRILQNSRDLSDLSHPDTGVQGRESRSRYITAEVWDQCRRAGHWLPWLEAAANPAVEQLARPDRAFGDFDLIRAVGESWLPYAVELGLPSAARGVDRGQIDDARRKLAAKRLAKRLEEISDGDVDRAVPLPEPIDRLSKMLMDARRSI